MQFDYAYISDPPIFADIGTAYLGVDGMTLDFVWNSTFTGDFELHISDLELDFVEKQPTPLFDGISDFSILTSNVLTTITAVVRNRAQSIINAQLLTPKINKIANKIIKLFPAQLPAGPFVLDGILAGNPSSTPEYARIPLSTMVTSANYPYPGNCTVSLPAYVKTEEY